MSGASLAAGDTIQDEKYGNVRADAKPAKEGTFMDVLVKPLRTPLTLIHTQLICFSAVLVASGAVPIPTLLFPVLATVYIILMAVLIFTPVDSKRPPAKLFEGDKRFEIYTVFETVAALILPVGYILGAFVRGDSKAVAAAAPHMYLLSCQILTENLAKAMGSHISLPIRALVPVLYNSARLPSLMNWAREAFRRVPVAIGTDHLHKMEKIAKVTVLGGRLRDAGWAWFGRGLAALNLVFWTANLFFFLVPLFVPRAMKAHFLAESEAGAKPSVTLPKQLHEQEKVQERMMSAEDKAKAA
jgi:hypothetical protein